MPSSSSQLDSPLPSDFRAPEILGLQIPDQFYWLRSAQPPLAGMQLPSSNTPWEELYRNGFRWIACLCSDQPLYDPSPLRSLVSVELCDLAEVALPKVPEKEERIIRIIADAVVQRLRQGEGVIVHCAGGRGRTGTVLGCVLRELGRSAEEIIVFLDAVHKLRGKPGWPEAEWQGEVVERTGTAKED